MKRQYLSLAALAVVLVALGIALVPFGWRDPYKARVDCSPALVSVWQTNRVGYQPYVPITPTSGKFDNLFPAQTVDTQVRTACAKKARYRLESSGVLLGLTLAGWLVGGAFFGRRRFERRSIFTVLSR